MEEGEEKAIKVLLTGFGAFQDVKINPSYEVVSRLSPTLFTEGNTTISLLIHPSPVPVTYNAVQTLVPMLLAEHRPDIVLHVGLDTGRDYFALEASAPRDGYHQVPDMERKVFTKAETKSRWGKLDEYLTTTIDKEDVLRRLRVKLARQHRVNAHAKNDRKRVGKDSGPASGSDDDSFRLSDDVGTYICGFIYYTSLAWYALNGTGDRPVVFLHVPPLPTQEDLEKGTKIVTALVEALAESEEERRGAEGWGERWGEGER